ncbi:MAG: DUF3275 family protein [Zoogloeaceae bacterium]|nr:DUF3275 family protein [Zoogloeaceae bacterium]
MSICIEGTLTVKAINGAKGSFAVGDLTTEVGGFRVKDAILDEFEPGQYKGRFVVGAIYPTSYTWRGKVFVEVRARLERFMLDEVTEAPHSEPEHDSEPDPIDERDAVLPPADPAPAPTVAPNPVTPEPSDVALFDAELLSLIEQGGPVKLDPAGIDRAVFRQQRDALKAQGFRFVAASQHWIRDPSN